MEEQKKALDSVAVEPQGIGSVEEIAEPLPQKPKPGAKLRKEGLAEGHPDVAFDPQKRCHYHLDRLGRRKYHGVPAGFEFSNSGELKPIQKVSQE